MHGLMLHVEHEAHEYVSTVHCAHEAQRFMQVLKPSRALPLHPYILLSDIPRGYRNLAWMNVVERLCSTRV